MALGAKDETRSYRAPRSGFFKTDRIIAQCRLHMAKAGRRLECSTETLGARFARLEPDACIYCHQHSSTPRRAKEEGPRPDTPRPHKGRRGLQMAARSQEFASGWNRVQGEVEHREHRI